MQGTVSGCFAKQILQVILSIRGNEFLVMGYFLPMFGQNPTLLSHYLIYHVILYVERYLYVKRY